MTDRGVRRVAGLRGALGLVVSVALVTALGVFLWDRGSLNSLICDGDCGPSFVSAPQGLTSNVVPDRVMPDAVLAPSADSAKVAAAVRTALGAGALGPHVGFVALDPQSGDVLATRGSGAYTPASTEKLLTGFAALSVIDPQKRFATTVVREGEQVVLVGGGDPYLASKPDKARRRVIRADLTTLASKAATVLKAQGVSRVRLGFDGSLFTGPAASPGWEPSYVSGNIVTPVSALWADQGAVAGVRSRDPARSAADIFAGLLRTRGIGVTGNPHPTTAPSGAVQIARVESATVAQIVSTLIRTSDNEAAEVMLRQVSIAAGQPASFDGGATAVKLVLDKAGVSTAGLSILDGSGLSRRNRVSPTTLAQTLRAALAGRSTSALLADLPVSGFTGTLSHRFAKLSGAYGMVRAKTGTLTGVHALTGYAVDTEGHRVIFALMADQTATIASSTAEAALDRVAAAIATCSCG